MLKLSNHWSSVHWVLLCNAKYFALHISSTQHNNGSYFLIYKSFRCFSKRVISCFINCPINIIRECPLFHFECLFRTLFRTSINVCRHNTHQGCSVSVTFLLTLRRVWLSNSNTFNQLSVCSCCDLLFWLPLYKKPHYSQHGHSMCLVGLIQTFLPLGLSEQSGHFTMTTWWHCSFTVLLRRQV